jgi:hypothetical protein
LLRLQDDGAVEREISRPVIPGSEMAARNATMQRQLSPARTSANLMARRCAAL